MHALADDLTEKEDKTQDKTLCDMKATTLVAGLADKLAEANADTKEKKLVYMEAEVLFRNMANISTKYVSRDT